ncbi:MAG: rhodanese-like domain-containing protein [Planctomycetota bacterium]
MFLRMIYDERLAQAAWMIGCQRTGEAIIIDPERDVDRYLQLAADNDLRIVATAETHIHADFLSGSRELAERVGAKVLVSGEGGPDWQYGWLDGYDHQLLHDGDEFRLGHIHFRVMHTPGHTPEHIVFVVTDQGGGASEPIGVVSGDFLFVGDLGRPDLLESAAGHKGAMRPSAQRLYGSLKRLEELAEYVQVWPAHGAGSACGKALGAVPTSTIGYEKRFNAALQAASSEDAFVDFILAGQPEPPPYFARMKRDNKVGPALLGKLPQPARLSPDDIRKLDGATTAIIDTRPWASFRAGHLDGALSIPLDKSFPTNAGSLIDEGEPIVLIVASESEAEDAVRSLVRIGYDRIVGWLSADDLQASNAAPVTSRAVRVADADALLASGEVRVLDVRRATEFAEGHIPGALNIAHTRLIPRLDEVPTGSTLLVVCRSGNRSARAVSMLQRKGFDVINLDGGMEAWNAAHSPALTR